MPKIDARLAPIRSCMMADCLRSTQPRSAATFSTNSITNATRPKAMPRSISMLWGRLGRRGPSPATSCGSRCACGRRRGGRVPGIADQLIAEPRESRYRLGQLTEQVLRARGREALAERGHHAPDDLPFGQRLTQGLDRSAEALHAPLEVGVGALALDPGGRRQHPVGVRAGPVRVGAG